jgi:hypothetical protein
MAYQESATDNHMWNSAISGGIAANAAQSQTVWMYVRTAMTTTQSICGPYNSTAGGGGSPPGCAAQIGCRTSNSTGTGQVVVWGWNNNQYIWTTTAPSLNTWFHVAWTWDGTTHSLYINGTVVNTSTATPAQTGTYITFIANGYPNTTNTGASGPTNETGNASIDDWRLYSRALTAAEVQTIYNLNGNDGIVNGLYGWFKFDEGVPGNSISTAIDYSGNGNNLTPLGSGATAPAYAASTLRFGRKPFIEI